MHLATELMNQEKFDDRELQLLKSAIQFFFRHIRFDESTVSRMKDNEIFHVYDERKYHHGSRKRFDKVLIDSVYETTETHIATFILSILHQGLFSVTSLIISIIYLSRFKEITRVSLHTYTWRLLFLSALLVADKANEDRPIKNGSLVKLFPILSADELNTLETTLLVRVKFMIFIRPELFFSFLDKLLNEKVSPEISAIVNNSDFARHHLFPNMRTVPSTPEPLMSLEFKTPVSLYDSTKKLLHPDHSASFIGCGTPRRLMAQTVAPVIIESHKFRRGRSNSVSGRNSSSSFIDDDNSLEYSRTSSRRNSLSRPTHVPAPPIFEPMKYQGHPRRLSLGKTPRDFPAADPTFRSIASRTTSPRNFGNLTTQRPVPMSQKWNGLF